MEDADVFGGPELEVFPFDVDALVIDIYEATITGIKALDKTMRGEYEEEGFYLGYWETHIQQMKLYAGNMGLVSLITLFHGWLEKKQSAGNWKSRFTNLVGSLGGDGPLELPELQEMVDARNSIIHQGSEANFVDQGGTPREVDERFLNFDDFPTGHVGIERELLTDLASKLKAQVEYWNRKDSRQKL